MYYINNFIRYAYNRNIHLLPRLFLAHQNLSKRSENSLLIIFIAKGVVMEKSSTTNVAPDIGSWEKHTKGIGLKLLQKFGFNGRLGAKENGVSRAIEVVVRPNNTGLGFGDIKEAASLKVNKKIEAEWRGVEFVDEEEGYDSLSTAI